MYSDGLKTYVISKAKMERDGLKTPAGDKKLEEFFKKHADEVIINETNVPSEKANVASASERN